MQSNQEKLIFVFNKFFTSLIKDVKKVEKLSESVKLNIKKNYKAIDKLSSVHILFFIEKFVKDTVVFNLEEEVFKDIKVQDVLDCLDKKDSEVFWNYMNILGSLALAYKESTVDDASEETIGVLVQTIIDVLGKKQKGIDVTDDISTILQEDIQNLLSKVDNVKLTDALPTDSKTGDNPFMQMFEGSKIGSLAKEISNDIDVSNLNIENSDDIMKLLDFSSSNNIMGDIIKKVSSKMHEKIANGELKQEDLFGEAMGMMGKMGGAGGGGGGLGGLASMFNNPMMSEMMKMASKGKAKPNSAAFKSASSRDRLRKKLDEKRKKTQEAEA